MRIHIIVLAIVGFGCQLADDPDPPKCPAGSHPELDRCTKDEVAATVVTIRAAPGGTSCSGEVSVQRPPVLDPETIRVKVGEEFQFDNADVVAHELRGTDGTAWLNVAAGTRSPFTSLSKAGTWGYRVSGCAKGGTVVVE